MYGMTLRCCVRTRSCILVLQVEVSMTPRQPAFDGFVRVFRCRPSCLISGLSSMHFFPCAPSSGSGRTFGNRSSVKVSRSFSSSVRQNKMFWVFAIRAADNGTSFLKKARSRTLIARFIGGLNMSPVASDGEAMWLLRSDSGTGGSKV